MVLSILKWDPTISWPSRVAPEFLDGLRVAPGYDQLFIKTKMINIDRVPLVRNGAATPNYYLLSRDEADDLLLLTDDLVNRANAIMLRVMHIQDGLAAQYATQIAAPSNE